MCLWMADCDHHGDGLTGEMSFLRGLGNGSDESAWDAMYGRAKQND